MRLKITSNAKAKKAKANKKIFENIKASQLSETEKETLLLNMAVDFGYLEENDLSG